MLLKTNRYRLRIIYPLFVIRTLVGDSPFDVGDGRSSLSETLQCLLVYSLLIFIQTSFSTFKKRRVGK